MPKQKMPKQEINYVVDYNEEIPVFNPKELQFLFEKGKK